MVIEYPLFLLLLAPILERHLSLPLLTLTADHRLVHCILGHAVPVLDPSRLGMLGSVHLSPQLRGGQIPRRHEGGLIRLIHVLELSQGFDRPGLGNLLHVLGVTVLAGGGALDAERRDVDSGVEDLLRVVGRKGLDGDLGLVEQW